MLPDAKPAGNRPGRLQLARMTLAILDGQRVEREPLRFDDRSGGIGVQTATQQYHSSHWVNWQPGDLVIQSVNSTWSALQKQI